MNRFLQMLVIFIAKNCGRENRKENAKLQKINKKNRYRRLHLPATFSFFFLFSPFPFSYTASSWNN